MRTLTTGCWIVLFVALLAFTYANPETVAVHIWPGLIWETRAPALVIGALLLGFVPTSLAGRAARWRLARRVAALEASLASQALARLQSAESLAKPASPSDAIKD